MSSVAVTDPYVEHRVRTIVFWNLQGAREHEFNIYIHARPGYSYTARNTKCKHFIDRQLKNPIQV